MSAKETTSKKNTEIRYFLRTKKSSIGFFPWGLLGLLLILLPLIFGLFWFAENSIESHVRSETQKELALNDLEWVKVDVSGQGVRLSGEGLKLEGEKAISIARNVEGDTWLGSLTAPISVTGNFTEPVLESTPEPTPNLVTETIAEPLLEPVSSTLQQNSRAIRSLKAQGFDAVESEQGVVVYLPPEIYFSRSNSDINLDARTKISEIASELNKDYLSGRDIEVSGHTDSVGSAEVNLATSKSRAEAAAAELVLSNIPLVRIKTTWFGEQRPRAEESTADGRPIVANRALNRRVEFIILNPDE